MTKANLNIERIDVLLEAMKAINDLSRPSDSEWRSQILLDAHRAVYKLCQEDPDTEMTEEEEERSMIKVCPRCGKSNFAPEGSCMNCGWNSDEVNNH